MVMRTSLFNTVMVFALAGAACLDSVAAQTSIYVYRDQGGVLNFTNIPSHDRDQTLVEIKRYRSSSAPKAMAANYSPDRQGSLRAMVPSAHVTAIVNRAATDYQVDQALVRAMIHAESAFNPQAVSAKGAQGLMQLMPATAQRFGVNNVFDPGENITGGVRYMSELLKTFKSDLRLALAAYNAGENAVLRYGGIPPYPETRNYVSKVMQLHALYRQRG